MKTQFQHRVGGILKTRKWSIIRGALRNDMAEIKYALEEDPECINDKDERMGVTALHIAAGDGNASLVTFLLAQPGCALSMDYDGRWPNFMARVIGRDDIADEINRFIASSEPDCDPDVGKAATNTETVGSKPYVPTILPFKPRGP